MLWSSWVATQFPSPPLLPHLHSYGLATATKIPPPPFLTSGDSVVRSVSPSDTSIALKKAPTSPNFYLFQKCYIFTYRCNTRFIMSRASGAVVKGVTSGSCAWIPDSYLPCSHRPSWLIKSLEPVLYSQRRIAVGGTTPVDFCSMTQPLSTYNTATLVPVPTTFPVHPRDHVRCTYATTDTFDTSHHWPSRIRCCSRTGSLHEHLPFYFPAVYSVWIYALCLSLNLL